MPQRLLPLIPDGASQINDRLSVVREKGQWTYFFSTCPVFQHDETDQRTFRRTGKLGRQPSGRVVDAGDP
jgi:hypothetical protein